MDGLIRFRFINLYSKYKIKITMKKKQVKISNPDELNKNLSYNSPVTWIVLGTVILLLVGFFAWSLIYKIQVKLFGTVTNTSGAITLILKDESKSGEIKVGQKVYVTGDEGVISSIDGSIKVSDITLADGQSLDCYVVINELKPIEFWFNNQ